MAEEITIPDFDFSSFYYPDFYRALLAYTRRNVPEITEERAVEPFIQLIRAFSLVGHLNNVLLDVTATETLFTTSRLLESVRSHLKLIDVQLDQAKPASVDIVIELSKIFETATNFIPLGTQVATEETDERPQIVFEADSDNIIQPTNKFSALFSFDPGFITFFSNVFHTGDKITVATVDFTPGVDFTIGATLSQTIDNFISSFNSSTNINIENLLFASRVSNTVFFTVLNDSVVSIPISTVDNELETTLIDATTSGTDVFLNTDTERRADDYTPIVDRTIKNVTFSLKKVGVPTGTVRCVIETDDGLGDPDGTILATSTNTIDLTTITNSYASYQFNFDSTAFLEAGTKYWFILEYVSAVGISQGIAEEVEVGYSLGTVPAVAEVSRVKFNNLPIFFDVIGKAKHWLLDAQGGNLYYVWYKVTDGVNVQTDGDPEITTVNFVGQTGLTYDVAGTAKHFIFYSANDAAQYYAWLNVTDGSNVQSDPALGGAIGLQVDILTTDTDAIIASKVRAIINAQAAFISTVSTTIVSILTFAAGVTTNTVDGATPTGAVIITTQEGSNSPIVPGRTGIQVNIVSTDGFFQIAQKTATAIGLVVADFTATTNGIDSTIITQVNAGDVADPVDVNAGITVTITTAGQEVTNYYDVAGNAFHWLLDAQGGNLYYVWHNVTDGDNTQTNPSVFGRIGIQVDILKADGPTQIANKAATAIGLVVADFTASNLAGVLTVVQVNPGEVADAVDVDSTVSITVTVVGEDEARISLDSSGVGSSRYYSAGSWSTIVTTLVMKIVADTTNFASRSGGFGLDKSGEAILPAATFPMFTLAPKPGSLFYVMHESIMWDKIDFLFDTFGNGIEGVWEFYDGNAEDQNPDSVTNLGPNLEMDITSVLGDEDRSGSLIEVKFTETGVIETVASIFENGINKVKTTGLLGQVTVSTDTNKYIVGSHWNEVSNTIDGTDRLTVDGIVEYDLPQTLSQNWTTKIINSKEGFFVRFRVISVDENVVVNPIVNLVNIQEANQYVIFKATQGETKSEVPVASSDGQSDQEIELTFKPLIVESLVVEVDEGIGFSQWSKRENFLTSTQISKDYVLEVTADDTATITFGDGTNGKIPAAGVDNIRAFYRIGAGDDGNVGSRTISINKSGIAFVNRVFNPRQATGWKAKEGSTPEDIARLKIEGPASLRVRERALAPQDYEFLSTQFVSLTGSAIVSRALAIEETFGVKTLELVVVGIAGTVLTQDQLDELADYFNGNKTKGIKGVGLSNHQAIPVNYTQRIINITAQVKGGLKEPIENALKGLLNPTAKFSDGVTNRWSFGDTVPLAIIISKIIEVDPLNIKNVTLTEPLSDIVLGQRELPLAGTLNIEIV